jgi:hypothetical protein
MTRLRTAAGILVVLLSTQTAVRADVVLDWNATAMTTYISQNPFAQARLMAITQLAVFEAVNAITGDYQPYLGGIVAPAGSSPEAAAVAAAYGVIKFYFPAAGTSLLATYNTSLSTIPEPARANGVAVGEMAASNIIATRNNPASPFDATDGSAPALFHPPTSSDVGVWQTTPSCSAAGGAFYQWQSITPFGVPSEAGSKAWIEQFLPGAPPALGTPQYAKDFNEVKRVGSLGSTERPTDRTNVARFYAAASPAGVFNSAARQIATVQQRTLSENARALALINMSSSDSLVASFFTKYYYDFWRPETAIRDARTDGLNSKTASASYIPLITTPCFPSYPSNHGSGSNGAAEMLRRLYGAAGHSITLENAALGLRYTYTSLKQITDDISDARVYGGIHFRFDQDAGGRLGRDVATYVYKHNLRPVSGDADGAE